VALDVLAFAQYRLIAAFADNARLSVRGFSATAGETVYEGLQVWAQDTGAQVEEDRTISVADMARS
jgi:hypothetical protein